jgi:hypothetical protein
MTHNDTVLRLLMKMMGIPNLPELEQQPFEDELPPSSNGHRKT